MTDELLEKVFEKAAGDLKALLMENAEGIKAAIGTKIENTENKVRVPIAASVTLAPMGGTCGVKVKISYGEKVKDEAESTVDDSPDLPGFERKKGK